MGCDVFPGNEHVPYCKPKCKSFKLVTCLEDVKAQCVRCSLLHELVVEDGVVKVLYKGKDEK